MTLGRKLSRRSAVFIILGFAVLLAVIVLLCSGRSGALETTEARVEYLAGLGWEADASWQSAGCTGRYPGCFAFFRTCRRKFCKAFSESCKNYRFCIDISV